MGRYNVDDSAMQMINIRHQDKNWNSLSMGERSTI